MHKFIPLIVIFFFTTPLKAADFIFNVPIKLNKIINGIPQAKIQCDVFSADDDQKSIASGYNIQPIYFHQGTLDRVVTVNVNRHPWTLNSTADRYDCQLYLLVPWAQPNWQVPSSDSANKAIHPAENSKLVTRVSGTLNPE